MENIFKKACNFAAELEIEKNNILSEEYMTKGWDTWRRAIASGEKGSWPRDHYESELSNIGELLENARKIINDLINIQKRQSIETAPKDGTKFLGLVKNDYIAMFWHPHFNEFVSSYRISELAPGYTFEDGTTQELHSPVIHRPEFWIPIPA